jgi:hypothetical protein
MAVSESCHICGGVENWHTDHCPFRTDIRGAVTGRYMPGGDNALRPAERVHASEVRSWPSDEDFAKDIAKESKPSVEELARDFRVSHFTGSEAKYLVDAIMSATRATPIAGEARGAYMPAEQKPEPGSIRSVFSYRAPRPDQLQRFNSIREGFILLAEIIANNCPPCQDKKVALASLHQVMMIANKSIALDGEELEV